MFRGAESGEPVLALVSGDRRADEAALARALGEPVERADADWVREVTGYAIGGVPPVGHPAPVRTLIDDGLNRFDVVWAAAGTPRTVFPIAPGELARVTSAGRWRRERPPARARPSTRCSASCASARTREDGLGPAGYAAVLRDVDAPRGRRRGARGRGGRRAPRHGHVDARAGAADRDRRPGEGEFRMLAVASAARGRGAGTALVRACAAAARARGHRALVCSSQDRMVAAHRIYARLGFVRDPARDWSPVPGVELLAFALPLEAVGGRAPRPR